MSDYGREREGGPQHRRHYPLRVLGEKMSAQAAETKKNVAKFLDTPMGPHGPGLLKTVNQRPEIDLNARHNVRGAVATVLGSHMLAARPVNTRTPNRTPERARGSQPNSRSSSPKISRTPSITIQNTSAHRSRSTPRFKPGSLQGESSYMDDRNREKQGYYSATGTPRAYEERRMPTPPTQGSRSVEPSPRGTSRHRPTSGSDYSNGGTPRSPRISSGRGGSNRRGIDMNEDSGSGSGSHNQPRSRRYVSVQRVASDLSAASYASAYAGDSRGAPSRPTSAHHQHQNQQQQQQQRYQPDSRDRGSDRDRGHNPYREHPSHHHRSEGYASDVVQHDSRGYRRDDGDVSGSGGSASSGGAGRNAPPPHWLPTDPGPGTPRLVMRRKSDDGASLSRRWRDDDPAVALAVAEADHRHAAPSADSSLDRLDSEGGAPGRSEISFAINQSVPLMVPQQRFSVPVAPSLPPPSPESSFGSTGTGVSGGRVRQRMAAI